jgi:hypothetical protein
MIDLVTRERASAAHSLLCTGVIQVKQSFAARMDLEVAS